MIQLRVLSALRQWLEHHCADFVEDDALRVQLLEFIDTRVQKTAKHRSKFLSGSGSPTGNLVSLPTAKSKVCRSAAALVSKNPLWYDQNLSYISSLNT